MNRDTTSFLSDVDAGEMAIHIARFDWAMTSLGKPEIWLQSLKTAITMMLASPAPMVTFWGEAGHGIYNDAFSQLLGDRHPLMLGTTFQKGWSDFISLPDDVLKLGFEGRQCSYHDRELSLHKNGQFYKIWVNLNFSPVRDASGTVIGVMGIAADATEKVVAERWLRNEHGRLRQMFEQAPAIIAMLHGPQHIFDLVNPAFLNIVDHRSVIGRSVHDIFSEPRNRDFVAFLDESYTSGKVVIRNAMPVFVSHDGSQSSTKRFIDFTCQPTFDTKGEIIGLFLQGVDVSEKIAMQDALMANEIRSRQILDGATDYAIIGLNLQGEITQWNKGARLIFGWAEEDVIGQSGSLIFTPEDRAIHRIEIEMSDALQYGAGNDERWHIRKNGERFWASGEMTPILNAQDVPIGFVKVLRDRTVEYLAEQSLREAEDHLRRAQEAGGVGLFSLSLDDNTLQVTSQFCRIFGLPDTETIDAGQVETLVLDEDKDFASNPESRKKQTAPVNTEYQIHRKDTGEKRIIARRAEFEHDETGKPVRFVGAVQDITETRLAQRAVRDNEAKFRALAQALPNHVWTAPANGQLDWFNERMYQYSGVTPGDLHNGRWLSIIHPGDTQAVRAAWKTALTTDSAFDMEFRLKRADGVYRWHISRALPIRDEHGTTIYWVGTNTDVEDLRATREALTHSNENLENQVVQWTADRDRLWKLSNDAMLVADFQTKIVACNPAWTTILGWEEEELVGKPFMEVVHPDDWASTLAEVSKLSQGHKTFKFENRSRRKDGTYRIMAWRAVPDENYLHAVGRDVTDEREAAEIIRNTEAALQQAQKMEAIGNLTGGVAHDFNNLLQVVSGNLQLLAKDVADNDRATRRIKNALSGVERGSKLASQLLAFGRRQALEPKVVNIGRFVVSMDDMLRRTIGEAIEIKTIIARGLWNTFVDPVQIENAILNLAINARDAMEGTGQLTIDVGNADVDAISRYAHDDVEPGQYVVLSVTDTGKGIPPEIRAKVFEPFFSTKPAGKGTGLGLSMVYGFVKQSGGHVKIHSEVDHGTTIKIYLPRSEEKEDIAVPVDVEPVLGGNETVLVAEDDEGVRSTVIEMLTGLGYKVLEAHDATRALQIVESGEAIDLLFTDVIMPGPLKSADMAQQAKERLPDLAVLFTSGYIENFIAHDGKLDQGVQLLPKPYTREQLARKVRSVLAGHGV